MKNMKNNTQRLSTLSHIEVPFDGDEPKAQRHADRLAKNAEALLEALETACAFMQESNGTYERELLKKFLPLIKQTKGK